MRRVTPIRFFTFLCCIATGLRKCFFCGTCADLIEFP
jgi:hypothetical protein